MPESEKSYRPLIAESAPRFACCDAVHLATDLMPVLDVISILTVMALGVDIYNNWLSLSQFKFFVNSEFDTSALLASVPAPFILYSKLFGFRARHGRIRKLLFSHSIRYLLYTVLVLAIGNFTTSSDNYPNRLIIAWVVFGFILTALMRFIIASVLRQTLGRVTSIQAIAIVGAGRVADRLVQALQHSHGETIELLGVFDDKQKNAPQSKVKAVGSLASLTELAKARKVDWIILTLPPTADRRILEIVQRLKNLSVPMGLCPQNIGSKIPNDIVDFVGDTVPVSLLVDRPIKRWHAVTKTIEDLALGGVITLFVLPVMAIIAIAIKIDSRGPILYKQKRHTLNNKEFYIYKFRSMCWNAEQTPEKLVQTSRNDTRITRVGRFLRATSLDEIPQLFNVLKGDMSLVGPRPHAINMRTEDRLGQELTVTYAHRHRVKPGLTGWAQVNGARGATDNSAQLYRRVRLDLEYIENWSVFLDLKILFMTISVVAKMTNAF